MIENEKLTLRGVRDIKNHVPPIEVTTDADGNEIRTPLTRQIKKLGAPGGRTSFYLKRWWLNGVSTTYTDATVFSITTDAGTVKLAIDSSISTNLGITVEKDTFDVIFSIFNEVERAALFTDSWQLIEHYVFPKISGGKVMTVIPAGAASRPISGPPATTIGTVAVSGATSSTDSATETYTVTVTGGTASGISYAWTVTGDGAVSGSATGASVNVDMSSGSATVSCAVSSSDAGVTNSPQSDSVSVTIT